MVKSGNAWMAHLAAFWKKNKGKMSYKNAMKKAKQSYTKKRRGGGKLSPLEFSDVAPPVAAAAPTKGGKRTRRRRTRKRRTRTRRR